MRTTFAAMLIFSAAACGGGGMDADDSGDDVAADDSGDDGGDDGVVPTGFQAFVGGDWSLDPGEEGYYCVRATVPEDMWIHAYRPTAPLGTHHTSLAIDEQGGPDGGFECEAGSTGFHMLFGSGVGTEPYYLPEGVAMKLTAGQQVILNLHLYNSSDAELTGHSGIEVERIARADVVHEAETIYALDFNVVVPPGASTFTGTCTIQGDSTIVGVFPHMHLMGVHQKVTAVRAGRTSVVMHDAPFTFGEQLNYAIDAVDVLDGDQVQYACGFENLTSDTIVFGDSTENEMCVVGMYRYPAIGTPSLCIH